MTFMDKDIARSKIAKNGEILQKNYWILSAWITI